MAAMGLWGLCITPGKPFSGRIGETVLVTNVALTDQLQDLESRTSVRITVTGQDKYEYSFILCSLIPGKVEQCNVNITLHSDAVYTFQAIGNNTVYVYGNYVDEFAMVRHLRDALKPSLTAQETHQTARSADQSVMRSPESAGPPGTADSVDPQPTLDPDNVRKRRRTNRDGGHAVAVESAAKEEARSQEVERSVSDVEGIQWVDYGAPGTGDGVIKWGDEVSLKYKMVMSSNGAPVADNIKSKPLRFVVGDISASIPQAVHYALVGMKLKAQRIIRVPLASAQKDTGLSIFLKPAQAFRIDIFVVEFTSSPVMASNA